MATTTSLSNEEFHKSNNDKSTVPGDKPYSSPMNQSGGKRSHQRLSKLRNKYRSIGSQKTEITHAKRSSRADVYSDFPITKEEIEKAEKIKDNEDRRGHAKRRKLAKFFEPFNPSYIPVKTYTSSVDDFKGAQMSDTNVSLIIWFINKYKNLKRSSTQKEKPQEGLFIDEDLELVDNEPAFEGSIQLPLRTASNPRGVPRSQKEQQSIISMNNDSLAELLDIYQSEASSTTFKVTAFSRPVSLAGSKPISNVPVAKETGTREGSEVANDRPVFDRNNIPPLIYHRTEPVNDLLEDESEGLISQSSQKYLEEVTMSPPATPNSIQRERSPENIMTQGTKAQFSPKPELSPIEKAETPTTPTRPSRPASLSLTTTPKTLQNFTPDDQSQESFLNLEDTKTKTLSDAFKRLVVKKRRSQTSAINIPPSGLIDRTTISAPFEGPLPSISRKSSWRNMSISGSALPSPDHLTTSTSQRSRFTPPIIENEFSNKRTTSKRASVEVEPTSPFPQTPTGVNALGSPLRSPSSVVRSPYSSETVSKIDEDVPNQAPTSNLAVCAGATIQPSESSTSSTYLQPATLFNKPQNPSITKQTLLKVVTTIDPEEPHSFSPLAGDRYQEVQNSKREKIPEAGTEGREQEEQEDSALKEGETVSGRGRRYDYI